MMLQFGTQLKEKDMLFGFQGHIYGITKNSPIGE